MDEIVVAQQELEHARAGLAQAVQRAREQGRTWADIGSVLGMSKQAAFKRFGSPRTPGGELVTRHLASDVGAITEKAFFALSSGDHEKLASFMTNDAARALTPEVLGEVWSKVLAEVATLEAVSDVQIELASGEVLGEEESFLGACQSVARLDCEGGEVYARLTFDQHLAIAGMLIRPSLENL